MRTRLSAGLSWCDGGCLPPFDGVQLKSASVFSVWLVFWLIKTPLFAVFDRICGMFFLLKLYLTPSFSVVN